MKSLIDLALKYKVLTTFFVVMNLSILSLGLVVHQERTAKVLLSGMTTTQSVIKTEGTTMGVRFNLRVDRGCSGTIATRYVYRSKDSNVMVVVSGEVIPFTPKDSKYTTVYDLETIPTEVFRGDWTFDSVVHYTCGTSTRFVDGPSQPLSIQYDTSFSIGSGNGHGVRQ